MICPFCEQILLLKPLCQILQDKQWNSEAFCPTCKAQFFVDLQVFRQPTLTPQEMERIRNRPAR